MRATMTMNGSWHCSVCVDNFIPFIIGFVNFETIDTAWQPSGEFLFV